jgi:hypothetical protein
VRAREAIVDRPLLTKKLRDEAGEKRKAGLRERWPEVSYQHSRSSAWILDVSGL